MKNETLIKKAVAVIKKKKLKGGLAGDIGCTLISGKGKVYVGVCSDAGSHIFCAETIAIGSMMTNKEYQIKKIVAVWKDDKGKLFIVPPCGNCRQLIKEVGPKNLDTEVIVAKDKTVKLRDLLPYHGSWEKV